MEKKILLINGPNLNSLGKRNTKIYDDISINELVNLCNTEASKLNIALKFNQSNSEGDIINWIQQAEGNNFKGIIINPGAYAHTSIAIMDAILDCRIPVIEVHISNIYAREPFRSISYTAKACKGVITGLGVYGYILALYAIDKK